MPSFSVFRTRPKKKLIWNLWNNSIQLTWSNDEYDRSIDSNQIFKNKILKMHNLLSDEEFEQVDKTNSNINANNKSNVISTDNNVSPLIKEPTVFHSLIIYKR